MTAFLKLLWANLPSIKDIFLAIAAILTVLVAWKGLNTWRRQLFGKTEYALVRRLLRYTYQYRDAIQQVRVPYMFGSEMANLTEEEAEKMNTEEIHHYNLQKGYERRWDFISKAKVNLEPALLEAEVLWGKNIRDKFSKLFHNESVLAGNLMSYFYSTDPKRSRHYKEKEEAMNKRDAIIFAMADEKKDSFYQGLLRDVNEIEDFIRPYLPTRRKAI